MAPDIGTAWNRRATIIAMAAVATAMGSNTELSSEDAEDEKNAARISDERTKTRRALITAIDDQVGGSSGLVQSSQVKRIVAVMEGAPLPTLIDGDLVIRYVQAGTIYYKDFSTDTSGGVEPSGMTKLLSGLAGVRAYAKGTGGNVLQVDKSEGTTAYAVAATSNDPFYSDVEFLVRWRYSSNHGLSTFFNVNAVAGSFHRLTYTLVSGTGRLRWTVRSNGFNVFTPEVTVPTLPTDSWCMMRARLADGVIQGKIWLEGAAEPDWQYSRAVADAPAVLAPGLHGVGGVDQFVRIDQVTHATGGRTAVKP